MTCILSGSNSLNLKTSYWWICFLQTCSFLLHEMLTDGLESKLWIIVMILSAVLTLILTAPIHCRGYIHIKCVYMQMYLFLTCTPLSYGLHHLQTSPPALCLFVSLTSSLGCAHFLLQSPVSLYLGTVLFIPLLTISWTLFCIMPGEFISYLLLILCPKLCPISFYSRSDLICISDLIICKLIRIQ